MKNTKNGMKQLALLPHPGVSGGALGLTVVPLRCIVRTVGRGLSRGPQETRTAMFSREKTENPFQWRMNMHSGSPDSLESASASVSRGPAAKRVATLSALLCLAAAFGAGCASTKALQSAETSFCAGRYGEAAGSARTRLVGIQDPGERADAKYILDNLYAGSASLMAGDDAGAAEAFKAAGEGIDDQDHSFLGLGYPTRTYDVSMAANYRAIALWAEGDIDGARVAFRKTADAQERADDRNARAIRKAEDEAEKRRASEMSNAGAKSGDGGESAGQVVSSLLREASSGAAKKQVDAYLSEYSSWSVYDNFQVPSTWFLDGLFSLANAEDASDLEHASFVARKAYGMVPSTPAKALFALAEARADGKLSAQKLGGVFAVVFENGLGPRILERPFHIPVPYKDRIYTLSFALPELLRREAAYPRLVVRDGAVPLGETVPVGDLDRVAVREFKARLPGIVSAQMFSAAVKLAIQIAVVEEARKRGGEEAAAFASYLVSAASVAATGTDTRHWNLLPKEIQAAVLKKPQTDDRAVELWVPGGAEPLATVRLPEKGFSVIYVKVPGRGLPPLVQVLGESNQ
jgi:hypothetical protein